MQSAMFHLRPPECARPKGRCPRRFKRARRPPRDQKLEVSAKLNGGPALDAVDLPVRVSASLLSPRSQPGLQARTAACREEPIWVEIIRVASPRSTLEIGCEVTVSDRPIKNVIARGAEIKDSRQGFIVGPCAQAARGNPRQVSQERTGWGIKENNAG